jgi:hypothetical protein
VIFVKEISMPQRKKSARWQEQLLNPTSKPILSSEARKRLMTYKESTVEAPYGFSTTVVKTNGVYRQVYVD